MSQQQHSARYASDTGRSLDNLQSGAKYITRGVTCTSQLTVSIATLDNQAAQIKGILHQFTSLLNSHTLLLTQFAEQLSILLFLRMIHGVDNRGLVDITQTPLFSAGFNLGRIAKENQIGYTVSQNLVSSLQSAFFCTFRKNNALAVRFRALNNFVDNVLHNKI